MCEKAWTLSQIEEHKQVKREYETYVEPSLKKELERIFTKEFVHENEKDFLINCNTCFTTYSMNKLIELKKQFNFDFSIHSNQIGFYIFVWVK